MKRNIRLILLGMCALLLLSSCSLFGNKIDLHHFLLKKAIDLTCEMDGLAESHVWSRFCFRSFGGETQKQDQRHGFRQHDQC